MRRSCAIVPLLALMLAPGPFPAAQEREAPKPAAPGVPEPKSGGDGAARERVLRRIEGMLEQHRETVREQVRRIIEQELKRADEEQRQRFEEARARADKALSRLKDVARRLGALREGVDRALADARKALAEPGEAGPPAPPPHPTAPPAALRGSEELPKPMQKFYQALSLYESGEYEKAIQAFTEAAKGFETSGAVGLAEARAYRSVALYRVACSHAVLGQADQAITSLEEAIRAGFQDLEEMENDAELDPLREDPRYDRLLRLARSLRG